MKENVLRICMVSGLLIILIGLFAFSSFASTNTLSNKMHAWGFRRGQNNEQPDLDTRKFRSIKEIWWFCNGKFRIKKCLSYF